MFDAFTSQDVRHFLLAFALAIFGLIFTTVMAKRARKNMGPQHVGFAEKHEFDGRVSWHCVWMEMAKLLAKGRSCDPRLKVGCVIVSADNTRVFGLGYNGSWAGGPNEPESLQPGKSGFVHAEVNALIKCDFHTPAEKIMYVTHSPCIDCARYIINARISAVYYDQEYRDLSGVELLKNAGIYTAKMSSIVKYDEPQTEIS